MALSVRLFDLVQGRPATDVAIRLDARGSTGWHTVAERRTNDRGESELDDDSRPSHAAYRLVCKTDPYFVGLGVEPYYAEIVITFRQGGNTIDCGITVLLAAAGYTVSLGYL